MATLERERELAVSISSPDPKDVPASIALQKERTMRLQAQLAEVY